MAASSVPETAQVRLQTSTGFPFGFGLTYRDHQTLGTLDEGRR